jgi:epoxyqueuosine reductase
MPAADSTGDELARVVRSTIAGLLADPEKNNLGPGVPQPAWGDFLLGFSAGDDDFYQILKEVIGPFHWSPAEAFAAGMLEAGVPAAPADLTVVSWALCQTEDAKASNRSQTAMPSELWARARIFGQAANVTLHHEVITALAGHGRIAVAPGLSPPWTEAGAGTNGWGSSWSERHVAHVCGLGTFGLCGGLITAKGKAVRFGSAVVKAAIPPTPRPYIGPFDYCLHHALGTCGECADRCPVGSVDPAGRNKPVCASHLRPDSEDYVRREYGFDGYGCGLCQTAVPCESGIPEELRPPVPL